MINYLLKYPNDTLLIVFLIVISLVIWRGLAIIYKIGSSRNWWKGSNGNGNKVLMEMVANVVNNALKGQTEQLTTNHFHDLRDGIKEDMKDIFLLSIKEELKKSMREDLLPEVKYNMGNLISKTDNFFGNMIKIHEKDMEIIEKVKKNCPLLK